jgi:hypothetical protein
MNTKNIKTALIIALVVGSVLNAINSYDVFLEARFSVKNIIRIVLTYITPFCVSLFSSINAVKQQAA